MPAVRPTAQPRNQIIETHRAHSYAVTRKTHDLVMSRTNGVLKSNPDMVAILLNLIEELTSDNPVAVDEEAQANDPDFIAARAVVAEMLRGQQVYGWCGMAKRCVAAMGIDWRDPSGYVHKELVYRTAMRYARRHQLEPSVSDALVNLGIRPSSRTGAGRSRAPRQVVHTATTSGEQYALAF